MDQVFVSIGSNINPKENIAISKELLNEHFDCTFSSNYETIAEGFKGDDFINCVAGFKTSLLPSELRKTLKQIEYSMGRTEIQAGMANRVIDLDLILYGEKVIKQDNFDIPSNDIEKYLFILEPLSEIAGELFHPVSKVSFAELLKQLKAD